jgi:hypothetical protein
MVERAPFQADDSDLPDFIMGTADAPATKEVGRPIVPPTARELVRERVAHERQIRKENQEVIDQGRKVYVKSSKKKQMFEWLLRLHDSPQLNPWERGFVLDLLVKFKRYRRVKWITQKQYTCLARIADKRKPKCP